MEETKIIEQGTPEWFKQRLGIFTSSELWKLFVSGKGKDQMFGATAMTYIRQIAAERDIAPEFLDTTIDEITGCSPFDLYLSRTRKSSKQMEFGSDMEQYAKEAFVEQYGGKIEPAEFILVNDYFGGSSDGIWYSDDGEFSCPIEIKNPDPATHLLYRQINNSEDLISLEKAYYLQCQGHMLEHNTGYCIFISFDIMAKHKLHVLRIVRDDDMIKEALIRLGKANEIVNSLISYL